MLGIYNDTYGVLDGGTVIPLPTDDDKRYVVHKFDGKDTLTFEIANTNSLYKHIAEEVKVRDESNKYVIKKIDEHSDFITIDCELDLDDWKKEMFVTFRETNSRLSRILSMIIPSGWSYKGADSFDKATTIEANEGEAMVAVTALEILDVAANVYGCVFNFDCLNKVLTAIDPYSFESEGDFFTDEINLKSIGFVGDSYNFATRLYAYGKKNEETGSRVTFASVNGGKEYIEDFRYSDKVISVGWSDERYENPLSLLEAARKKLEELCYPVRSYTCEVMNLNSNIWMYKVVTLIDRRRETKIEHRVTEYKEYPRHDLDEITLSVAIPSTSIKGNS